MQGDCVDQKFGRSRKAILVAGLPSAGDKWVRHGARSRCSPPRSSVHGVIVTAQIAVSCSAFPIVARKIGHGSRMECGYFLRSESDRAPPPWAPLAPKLPVVIVRSGTFSVGHVPPDQ